MLDLLARLGLTLAGLWLISWTLMSIIRMLLLPRSDNVPLTRFLFYAVYKLFYIFHLRHREDYHSRDRALSFWVPITLIALLVAWMTLIWLAYTLIYLGISQQLNVLQARCFVGTRRGLSTSETSHKSVFVATINA